MMDKCTMTEQKTAYQMTQGAVENCTLVHAGSSFCNRSEGLDLGLVNR